MGAPERMVQQGMKSCRAIWAIGVGALVLFGASARADQTLWDVLRAQGVTPPPGAAQPPHPGPSTAPTQAPFAPMTQPTRGFGGLQSPQMVPAQQMPVPGAFAGGIGRQPGFYGGAPQTTWPNAQMTSAPRSENAVFPRPSESKAAPRRTAAIAAISAIAATPGPPPRLWDVLRAGSQADELGAALFPTRPNVTPQIVGPDGTPVASAGASKPRKPRSGIFGIFDEVGQTFDRFARMTKTEIKATGTHSMGYHMESISGNRDSYLNSTYNGRPMLGNGYANTNLDVRGKFLGVFNFETHYSNSLYGSPYENRLSLNYATKELKLDAGDIQGGIHGNSLLDFSRSLKGIQLAVDVLKGVRFTTLYSQTKAQTRTITINGANRSGPYYVYAGQVVDGSVKVRVNNRDMVLDQDYTLDPYTGELNFKNGLIIQELDTIAVTFEAYGYNQSAGTLTGYRTDLSLIKNVKLGLSYVAQTGAKAGSTTATKTEQFYGYNNANTPYQLDYPVDMIVTKDAQGNITSAVPRYPMTVTIGDIPQIYNVDYVVDPLLPNRVFFKAAIPSTQIIHITYVPLVATDTIGDRSAMGLDAGFSLGKKTNIGAELATSRYTLGSTSVRGAAWQVRGDSKFLNDALNWTWTLRNIDPNYTAIESPGFQRNESGATTTLDYRPSKTVRLSATLENSKRAAYSYGLSGSTTGMAEATGRDNFTQVNLAANWTLGKGGQLSLTHNDMRTRLAAGGYTTYGTDSLSFSGSWKALSGDFSLQRSSNASSSLLSGASTSTTSSYATDSLTSRLNLQYRASDRLQLQSGVSISDIRGNTGSTQAQDLSFSADYAPFHNLRFRANYQLQDSGSSSLLTGTTTTTTTAAVAAAVRAAALAGRDITTGNGLYGGSLTGGLYGAGGYNGGLGGYGNFSGGFGYGLGSYATANYAGRSRSLSFQTSYQPLPPLTLEMVWNTATSLGDYLYNSTRNDLTFNMGYALGDRMTVNSALSLQKVSYIGDTGGTSSSIWFLSFRGRPWGKLTTTLNYQLMRTTSTASSTSNTGTGTSNGNLGGGLYGGGYGSGYGSFYGSTGTNLTSYLLRLEYPIWRGNSLYFQFDTSDSTGYLASSQRTLSMGIAFDLNRGMQFTLGWRNQLLVSHDQTSAGASNYNYTVHSLDADLNMHF